MSHEDVWSERPGDLTRCTLYKSRDYMYLVYVSADQTRHRILRILRVPPILAQDKTSVADEPPKSPPEETVAETPAASPPGTPTHYERSSSSVVLSIADDDEHAPQAVPPTSGTLSSEITELASSLVPEHATSIPGAPENANGKYLGLYDADVLHLRLTAEWKQYTGATDEPRAEAPERTVRPISDLGRTPEQAHTPPPPPPPPSSAPSEAPSEPSESSSDSAWALRVTAYSSEHTPPNELHDVLAAIYDGAGHDGPCKEVGRYFGLVGFVRFTAGYYMVLISKRSVVSLVGGHYIYHCDETQVVPLCSSSVLYTALGRNKTRDASESSLLRSFSQVDLSKNFYFSYTYDITRTLQENMTGPRAHAQLFVAKAWGYKEKFLWNYQLLEPAFGDCRDSAPDDARRHWIIPLVHGFVDQAKLNVLGTAIYVSLIARRSRHFAGARFYKRGINVDGYVANDVETEQIVSKPVTTPFYWPASRFDASTLRASPHFASYVMMRGSIPVFWTQDSNNMSPRPPIEISVVDPYYTAAMRHFRELFSAYGTPVIVLNLVKSKERQPRESKLLRAFTECIEHLNGFLPSDDDGKDHRIRYIPWDMSRASKSRNENVIEFLEELAEEALEATQYFHSGPLPETFCRITDPSNDPILLQHGIVRVNCVDCLDRTNAAQFVLGKVALAHQLHALGLLKHPRLSFDSDAVDMLTEMYHDLGDTIALQYGGSALAHTTDTYRKINHWSSHSRDMLEGIRRYYANSFADAEKQASIDLFLGQEPSESRAMLHEHAGQEERTMRLTTYIDAAEHMNAKLRYLQHFVHTERCFWDGYYRPTLFTDLQRLHAYKMTAVHLDRADVDDPMPMLNESEAPSLEHVPKHMRTPTTSSLHRSILGGMRQWIKPSVVTPFDPRDKSQDTPSTHDAASTHAPARASEPVAPHPLEAVVHRTMHPSLSRQEAREYLAYCTQFDALPFRLTDHTTDTDLHIYEQATSMHLHGFIHTRTEAPDAVYAAFTQPPLVRFAAARV